MFIFPILLYVLFSCTHSHSMISLPSTANTLPAAVAAMDDEFDTEENVDVSLMLDKARTPEKFESQPMTPPPGTPGMVAKTSMSDMVSFAPVYPWPKLVIAASGSISAKVPAGATKSAML